MLERRDLMLVEAIAQHGTFARAARALNMGQPALTRAIAAIEHQLQGAVFHRSRHGAALTDLGRLVLAEAAPILARFRGLDARLVEAQAGRGEMLRVAAGGYAAEMVGIPACAAMLESHPGLRISLATMNWADALRALRSREASLSIMELSEISDTHDLAITPLSPHPGCFAVRVGHPLLRLPAPDLAAIMAYPFVFLDRSPDRILRPFVEARAEARARGHAHPAFPAVIHESPSAALALLPCSDAVGAATATILRPLLRAGMIELVRWRPSWLATNYGIVQLRDRRLAASAEAFIEAVKRCDTALLAEDDALLAELGEAGGAVPACSTSRPVHAAAARP